MTLLTFFSRINLIIFSTLWLTAAIGLFLVPFDAVVPIVWNPIAGEPAVFGPGWLGVLIMPALGLLVITIFGIISRSKSNKEIESARHFLQATLSGLLFMFLILEGTFIFMGLGSEVYYPKVAALMVGVVLLVMGNTLPKSQPNKIIGMALPRAVHDPDIWQFTHRWNGRITVLSGFILIVFTLTFLDGPSIFMGAFTAIAVPIVSGIALSYFATPTQN